MILGRLVVGENVEKWLDFFSQWLLQPFLAWQTVAVLSLRLPISTRAFQAGHISMPVSKRCLKILTFQQSPSQETLHSGT